MVVRIGADAGIRISDGFAVLFTGPDRLTEIFEVHLVADAGAGRNNAEVLERLLSPLEEAVTLAVALVFELDVAGKSGRRAEFIDNDRVVDDEIDRNQRVDLFRIAAECLDAVAHGCEIDDCRNAGEVLHQHAGWTISDLSLGQTLVVEPFGNRQDLVLGNGLSVFEAQQVFKQNLHREGQFGNVRQTILLGFRKAVIDIVLTAYGKDGATIETVDRFSHG
jgi:hypothetical protein